MMNVEGMLKHYSLIRKAYAKHLCTSMKEENYAPSEIDILIFLSNNPSINTSKELGVCLGISKSLVCRSVDALMDRGLLEMNEDQRDKRIQRLTITQQAYPLITVIKDCKQEFAKKILTGISQKEMDMVEKTMEKINQNIQLLIGGESGHENVK